MCKSCDESGNTKLCNLEIPLAYREIGVTFQPPVTNEEKFDSF